MEVITIETFFTFFGQYNNLISDSFIIRENVLFFYWISCFNVFFKQAIPSGHAFKNSIRDPWFV